MHAKQHLAYLSLHYYVLLHSLSNIDLSFSRQLSRCITRPAVKVMMT